MGVTQELAREIATAKFEDIPTDSIKRVRDAVLDDVGIALLGYSAEGTPLVEYAKDVGRGVADSTIIGDGTKVSCMAAAAVNSMMAWDTCMYETGPGHHELSSMAQTAISIGERVGASGKDILTAVALAYQLNGRFHRAATPPEYDKSLGSKRHIILSVAITAGKLLGLTETELNHALGIAWFYRPQPREFQFRHVKTWYRRIASFHLGTCTLGIQAALLAQHGFDGPLNAIEQETWYDLDRLMQSPSPYYYPANELYMKPWVAPQSFQPGIQAALEIVKDHEIQVKDIQKVTFFGEEMLTKFPFSNPTPTDYWEAIYSGQWAIAMALLGYEPGREWTTEQNLRNPECQAMAQKVALIPDPEGEDTWMDGMVVSENYSAEVQIVVAGETYKKRISYPEQIGSPRRPMSKEQLQGKFLTQATPVIGKEQSELLVGMLYRLEEQDDIRNITKLFKPGH